MTRSGSNSGKRFRLKRFSEIKVSTRPNYPIKGILPRVGLAVIWGPPKCGKSFWTFDAIMHIALDLQYRGQRVQQGTVVYCALEGGTGFARRVEAWRQRYVAADHDEVPFYLLDVPLDLAADHPALIQAILEQITDAPSPVCIVIDTLNRALAGSENRPEDMAKFIRAADALRVAFDCLVVIVHHSGIKGGRPRGHTSLPGADDVQIKVERDSNGTGTITATVEHMKDDEAGATVVSRLERVELGADDDGEAMSSCVIVACDGVASPQRKTASKDGWGKSKSVKLLRGIVRSMLAEQVTDLRPFANGPIVRALRVEQVRAEFFKAHYADGETEKAKQNAKRMAFKRAVEAAVDKGKIVTREVGGVEYIWLAHADNEAEASTVGAEFVITEAAKETPARSAPPSPPPARVGRCEEAVASKPNPVAPITADEMDELRQRGFSPDELFNMSPKRAREIIADPERNKLTEKYGKGGDTPAGTLCKVCKQEFKDGKPPKFFSEPLGPGERQDRFPGHTPLHLVCCPRFFESGLPMED